VFCQNYDISHKGVGSEVTAKDLARMMMRLQNLGCHNINFVTPEHVVAQILEALPYAIEMGLNRPLVYNTGTYDSLDSIRLMEGVVDIYMPDFKMWSDVNCRQYLLAPDYATCARRAIEAMHKQVGELKVDEEGIALRGILLRHLVMPGMNEDSREIFRFLADKVSRDTYINIMDQYYPSGKVSTLKRYASLQRRISGGELSKAYEDAAQAGLWRFDLRWRSQ